MVLKSNQWMMSIFDTSELKGEQKMEVGDLVVFVIALGIVVAGGVITIKEILQNKGGEKD